MIEIIKKGNIPGMMFICGNCRTRFIVARELKSGIMWINEQSTIPECESIRPLDTDNSAGTLYTLGTMCPECGFLTSCTITVKN